MWCQFLQIQSCWQGALSLHFFQTSPAQFQPLLMLVLKKTGNIFWIKRSHVIYFERKYKPDRNWIYPKLAGLQIAGRHFRSLDFFICLPPICMLFDGGYVYCFPQMSQVKRLFWGYIYSEVYICFIHSIFSSFGFWYFGHFSCMIIFPKFFVLPTCLAKCNQRLCNIFVFSLPKVTKNQNQK